MICTGVVKEMIQNRLRLPTGNIDNLETPSGLDKQTLTVPSDRHADVALFHTCGKIGPQLIVGFFVVGITAGFWF